MIKGPVLVTGGAGYIGSVLVRQLLRKGLEVRVADSLRSGGESLLELVEMPNFRFHKVDVRNRPEMAGIVNGCRSVVHLAAIVGDPACKKEPELAIDTNVKASKQLYEIANEAKCGRFVFASTCSNYGKMPDPEVYMTEESALAPVSLYAETKVEFERYLLGQSRGNPCKPTCLRFSTVYGHSPRIRFDLTVNEFTKDIFLGRELEVYGEQFWRPYGHVTDLARSIGLVLETPPEKVGYEVFNVGDTAENYTKIMLVEEIRKVIPGAKVKYVRKQEDPRDYKVGFEKIRSKLGFRISKRVPDGISEVVEVLRMGLLSNPDDRKYYNS
jgi:nucleoside-diphosphate-sugar epimerase